MLVTSPKASEPIIGIFISPNASVFARFFDINQKIANYFSYRASGGYFSEGFQPRLVSIGYITAMDRTEKVSSLPYLRSKAISLDLRLCGGQLGR